jgi:hypothetical protein
MSKVLLVCTLAVVGVMIVVLMDRYRLERLRHEFEELQIEVESRIAEAPAIARERG